MKRAASLLVATLFAALTTRAAEATPTIWQKAASPVVAKESALLEEAEVELQKKKIHEGSGLEFPGELNESRAHLMLAKRALEDAGGNEAKDPWVRLVFAAVLSDVGMWKESAIAYESLVASDVPSVLRGHAYADLAVAYARLGKVAEQIVAYEEALRFEPESLSRSLLLANQAEAYMIHGDPTRAVDGYRAALAALSTAEMHVGGPTTLFSLGVALDRTGDLAGAFDSIQKARSYHADDRGMKSSTWFFVPSYEEHYFGALGDWLVARTAEDPYVRLMAFERSIANWESYLAKADPAGPYVAFARARLDRVRSELTAFKKRFGKIAPKEELPTIRALPTH